MRIEAYNMVSQVYQANKPKQVSQANKTGKVDQVQISSFGRDLQIAKQAVKDASDVRENVTAPIKQSINNGTYNVSGEDFASKLLEKYQEKIGF